MTKTELEKIAQDRGAQLAQQDAAHEEAVVKMAMARGAQRACEEFEKQAGPMDTPPDPRVAFRALRGGVYGGLGGAALGTLAGAMQNKPLRGALEGGALGLGFGAAVGGPRGVRDAGRQRALHEMDPDADAPPSHPVLQKALIDALADVPYGVLAGDPVGHSALGGGIGAIFGHLNEQSGYNSQMRHLDRQARRQAAQQPPQAGPVGTPEDGKTAALKALGLF